MSSEAETSTGTSNAAATMTCCDQAGKSPNTRAQRHTQGGVTRHRERMTGQTYTASSADAEAAFDKMRCIFLTVTGGNRLWW